MSQQEQDAIVGRVIREKSEALRQKAALDAELQLVGDTCAAVFRQLHSISSEEAAGQLEPIRKYFDTDAFLHLLKEREQAQARVFASIKQLRALGVSE